MRSATSLLTDKTIWMVSLGVWLTLGIFYGNQTFFDMLSEGMQHSYGRLFIWGALSGLIWGFLAPPILALTARFPIEKSVFPRSFAVHVLGFLVTHVVFSACGVAVTMLIRPFDPITSGAPYQQFLLARLRYGAMSALVLYILVVSVGVGIEYRRRVRKQELEFAELGSLLAQAEVASLRSQLQPHFLFNTLNGIVSLVRSGENDTAEKMLMGLSRLLRYALDDIGRPEVELRQELEFLGHYLEIEKMRFPDRLRVTMDIAPEAESALIPSLLLQPLVENAIRHAVAQRLAPTEVQIRAHVSNERLTLTVVDDGPGLAIGYGKASTSGIGLANTRRRLEATYGGECEMTVQNGSLSGTEVQLSIPLRIAGGTSV